MDMEKSQFFLNKSRKIIYYFYFSASFAVYPWVFPPADQVFRPPSPFLCSVSGGPGICAISHLTPLPSYSKCDSNWPSAQLSDFCCFFLIQITFHIKSGPSKFCYCPLEDLLPCGGILGPQRKTFSWRSCRGWSFFYFTV